MPGGRIPLISPWLYRLSVSRQAARAAAGDTAAVKDLARIFCTAGDPGARSRAERGLSGLTRPDQIACLCRETILHDCPALINLTQEQSYLPQVPEEQALFLFFLSRMDDLRSLDREEHCPLLARGYAAAPATIRARVLDAARKSGTCGTLARALAGEGCPEDLSRRTFGEWEVIVDGVISEKRWDDLWLITPLAPLPLAVTAVHALKTAGWSPPGDDRPLWDEIAASAVSSWTYPVPPASTRPPTGKPAGQVTRAIFSPDGTLLATASCDGTITLIRTVSAGSAPELRNGNGPARFLAISPDNSTLLSCSDDGSICSHRISDAVLLWQSDLYAVAAAAGMQGTILVVADTENRLVILDIRDGRRLAARALHASPVAVIAVSTGGTMAACGHADGTVSFARYNDDGEIRILPGNGSPVRSLAFTEDGTACLMMYENGQSVIGDPVTGRKIRTIAGQPGHVVCTALPTAGSWFAIGSSDHTIRCHDRSGKIPPLALPLYSRSVTCCSAAPDGSVLAAGFHDGTVRIYRMPEGRLLREMKAHKKTVISCSVAPDNSRLVTVSWDGTTKLWRLPTMEIIRTIDSHEGTIVTLAGPAGSLLAAVTADGIARVIDGADGRIVRTIDLYTPQIRTAAMSSDGRYLASAGANATVRLWDPASGDLVCAGNARSTSERCCAFLPDGSALVAGGWDGRVRFYRVPDLLQTRTLTGHTSTVTCLALSRDGEFLATGSNDTTVRLWRLLEDGPGIVLPAGKSEVSAIALSPDGTLLAAGNAGGTIPLFRLPYGSPAGEIGGLPGKVTALAFTADGCILAAGYDTGVIAYYAIVKNCLIRTVPAHAGAVTGLAVLPGGETLVSSGGDGLCCFHPLPQLPFPARFGIAGMGSLPHPGSSDEEEKSQWAFLSRLLAARFRGEIGICPPSDMPGCYDIQIAG